MLESFANFLQNTGLYALISSGGIDAVKTIIMIAIACVLLYLAIVKKFEPLLLLPIAFGMLLSNLPMIKDSSAIMMHTEFFTNPEYMTDGKYINVGYICQHGGLLDLLYLGVKLGIYPPLIFVGIGCMTDFGPLIANPKSILLGAAAQFGVFFTFVGALVLSALTVNQFRYQRSCVNRYYRRCRRPYGYLRYKITCTGIAAGNRRCGIFIYGIDSCNSTAYYETYDS